MAGNTVTLGFAGDSTQLEKTLEKVGAEAKEMASDVGGASVELRSHSQRMGEGFDRAGEGADGAETRIMGLKDSVDGAATIMAGPGEQGIAAYLQGWADLASGIANFAVPAIKAVVAGSLDQVKATATAVASTVAGVATQVAQWVVMGAQATAQAARIAAAWLVSVGPVVLVGAAIAGLVYVVVRNWDTIKEAVASAARFVAEKIGNLVDAFASVGAKIGGALGGVAETILAPYKWAFEQIRKLWNNTVGGFEFSIPSWIPGVGGKGFRIPEMHTGGIVPGVPGTEVPILAMAGERMSQGASSGSGSGGGITVVVLDPSAVVDAIDRYERSNGRRFQPAA